MAKPHESNRARSGGAGAWIRAARPLAHANIAPPLLLGQALAVAAGAPFEPRLAVVAFGFGVLDHLFIVFANDYADRDADALGGPPTIFSGGSRVIQRGLLSAGQLRAAALVAGGALLSFSCVAGLALDRPWLPALAIAALVLLFAYSFPPLRLSYRGLGELAQGAGVGLVLPLVGYYVQTGDLAGAPWAAFAPLVLLAFVSNIITALPDVAGDRAAGKRSWPVRRGEARARRDVLVLLGLGVLFVGRVGPSLSPGWLAAVLVPPALCVLAASRELFRADAASRGACLRFVALTAGAITILQLIWSLALWLRPG